MAERSVLLEIAAAVLLGIAALLTALCAYQANEVGGDASAASSASSQALIDANFYFGRGNATLQFDKQVFLSYVNALNAHDEQAAKLIDDTVMSDELRDGIKDLKDHPDIFDDDDSPYFVEDINDAEEQQALAERLLAGSGRLGDQASQYQISAVLFSVTLFFSGIATLFKTAAITLPMLAVAGAALVAGGAFALTA